MKSVKNMDDQDSTLKEPSLEALLAAATGIYFHGLVEVNGAPALSLAIRDTHGKVHEVVVLCSSELAGRAEHFMTELQNEVISTFKKEDGNYLH